MFKAMRTYVTVFFLLISWFSFAQIINRDGTDNFGNRVQERDSLKRDGELQIELSGKTTYKDYKIISYKYDTTYVDTTLAMFKDYKFNYIRKDDFELMPFHNQGQTFNRLAYNFDEATLFPEMGATAKHYNFYGVKDINYYSVATPTTELMYRTGLEQGQVLDGLFTFNLSKRLNISLAYKGLRSLGKYRNTLSSHGNMRITGSYQTKNSRYSLRSHVVAQDLSNQENGGLTDVSIENFEADSPDFSDRARLETNFTDASNYLQGNRYYFEHGYNIWQRKDSLNNTKTYLKLGNSLNYELKKYRYSQTAAFSRFGNSFTAAINDNLSQKTFKTQAFLALKSPVVLGELKFKTDYYNFNRSFTNVVVLSNQIIPDNLSGNAIAVGGEWKTRLKKFNIEADAATILTGDVTGNYLKASASFKQDSLFTFKGTFLTNTRSPNFNFLLNQSSYVAFNWNRSLKNESIRSIIFDLKSDKLLNANAQITQIDNYTYFGDTLNVGFTNNLVQQASKTVNYLKVKVSREFKFGKFGLNNTMTYQKSDKDYFNVPEFVTRNTFYFADYLFKGDPLYLQTGITFNYFTEYNMNEYNPVLSEFQLQNQQKIGGYPTLDFFVNGQIQRTRLFFKIEHFNSSFNKRNYYSAPRYPYRDFVIRFGLVWNFFI